MSDTSHSPDVRVTAHLPTGTKSWITSAETGEHAPMRDPRTYVHRSEKDAPEDDALVAAYLEGIASPAPDYHEAHLRGLRRVAALRGWAAVGDPADKFERLAKLAKDWDSYGGEPISPAAIQRAKDWLANATVVPMSEGGVQIEWHSDGVDVEIGFRADGTTEAFAEEVRRRVPPGRETP